MRDRTFEGGFSEFLRTGTGMQLEVKERGRYILLKQTKGASTAYITFDAADAPVVVALIQSVASRVSDGDRREE